MPARTNEFQRLVKVINKHLAPVGAKVTESAMLFDNEAQIDREVDILVESTMLNCDLRIGIECTTEGRPLDVRTIESFREKHRKLGVSKTVLVSKNGFSEPAKNYAEKNHIRLLTFNHARAENWLKKFESLQGLSMYARRYFLKQLAFTARSEGRGPDFVVDTRVIVKGEGREVPVEQFAADLFTSSEISRTQAAALRENEQTGGADPWVTLGFDLNERYEFVDADGRSVKPLTVEIVMGYRSNYRPLDMRQVTYDGHSLAVGSFFEKSGGAQIAFSESEGKVTATFEISDAVFPKLSTPDGEVATRGRQKKKPPVAGKPS